jgi:glycosyltransferase involved in cell wall biosynthesis
MKVCMINDSSSMGETLLKYLPFQTEHMTRSRRALSKTVGLTARILLAKADLYHVFYILQDAYLSLKMRKKPVVGHACGSDIRDILHSRWGWMVRYSLRNLNYVLSAQPTLLPQIMKYTNRVEYFPIPIDPRLFSRSPLPEQRTVQKVLYTSPVDFRIKGTGKVLQAVSQVKRRITFTAIKYGPDVEQAQELARKLGTKVEWIKRQTHDEMAACYSSADIVIGNFGVGQLDTTVIEAMASGRPVVHHLAPEFFPNVPLKSYHTVDEFANDIEALLTDRRKAAQQIQRQLDYVKIHYADRAAKRLVEIYTKLTT